MRKIRKIEKKSNQSKRLKGICEIKLVFAPNPELTNGYGKIGENEKVACDNTADNGCHSITFRETDNFPFSQCVVFCLLPIKVESQRKAEEDFSCVSKV